MKPSSTLPYLLSRLACLAAASAAFAQPPGFRVQGDRVLDANGSNFVMVGLNHPHAWFKSQLNTSLPAIAATGANTVRIVLSNGRRWTLDNAQSVGNIISMMKQRQMVSVLEVHDATGFPEQSGSVNMSTAVDYWIQIKGALEGQERFVIINIANEPFGNNVSADTYIDAHKTAITRLRAAGIRHALMVDAANWGQDWQNIMRARAGEILKADPDGNVIFSVHMYDVYDTDAKVNAYMQDFKNKNLALVVGEYAADHGAGKPVAASAILQRARQYGYGHLGWSWKGNGSGLQSLDIAVNWNGSPLTAWGELLVNSPNGIRATAVKASVLGGPISIAAKQPQVDGFGMRNGALAFSLPHPAHVRATLLDSRGRIRTLILDGSRGAGSHSLAMPQMAEGAYFLDFRADGFRRTLSVRR